LLPEATTVLSIEPIRRLGRPIVAFRTVERALTPAVMRPIGGRACRLMTIPSRTTAIGPASPATATAIAIPAIGTVLPLVPVLALLLWWALRAGILTLRTIGAIERAVVAIRRLLAIRQRAFHRSLVATGRRVAEARATFGRRFAA
jgi:hypothetical protein